MSDPAGFLTRHLDAPVALQPVSGGDTHRAYRASLRDGREVFVKTSHAAHPFEAEARGLHEMRASGTPLTIPEPLAWDAHHLVLPWLAPGPPAPDADLGVGLAVMHRHTAPAFGFPVDGSCGATPQANGWCDDWPTFFIEQRVRPLLRLLAPTASEARIADAFVETLPERLCTDEAPAIVHGDLWSGNHLHTADGHALVDPAAHFAHREFELGMMTLFGGFRPRVYEVYRATWPLAEGWEERVAVYRLYHVLNHAVLFGGGYRSDAFSTMAGWA